MGKTYTMSDIHGYLEVMEGNFKKINLENKENQLIFCGDYTGYGSKS
jgi:predicted phosphodiesterase